MWLDRLSKQPTPSGSPPMGPNRSFSPVPRRPSHLAPGPSQRPGYSPRSSSLSIVSRANSSTSSLAAPGRIPNGSTLKQEITPPPSFDDPLQTLARIIGSPLQKEDDRSRGAEEEESTEKPPELVEDITFDGLSLQNFADSPLEPEEDSHGATRSFSIEEYDEEKDTFQDLRRSILACDNVLKSVEISLTSFQKDLGLVSAEIETLQSRSTALNTRLENRKVVEKLLGPAVEAVSISPAVVRAISEGPIDENWVTALAELEKRSKVIEDKLKAIDVVRSVSDIKPLLESLTNKAIERIRDYLIAAIKSLRSPNINAQIIQQQTLVNRKALYAFLSYHHPPLAEDLGRAYINTTRWYFLANFTRYRHSLALLPLYHLERTDALGSDPSTLRPTKPPPSSSLRHSHPAPSAVPFTRRLDILSPALTSALPSHLTTTSPPTFLETPFHSFHRALLDNAAAEYVFLTDFFAQPFPILSRKFTDIFEPTFALGRALVKDLIDTSFDCLGILLCVRLNQRFAFELQRRKVPVLDSYINGVNMLLWPRFQVAMDAHCESIRTLSSTLSSQTAASKLSSPFSSAKSPAAGHSTAPHYLTQRFSQFLLSILAASVDAGDDEPVSSSLGRLRNEYEAFLVKASKAAGGGDGKKRERFMSNNYSLVLTIIGESEGRLAEEMKAHFEGLRRGMDGYGGVYLGVAASLVPAVVASPSSQSAE